MFLIKSSYVKNIDKLLNALIINLENNYKDLALEAFKNLKLTFEEYKSSNLLKPNEIKKYSKIILDYETRLKDYHH